jgi:hypothetical protein
MEVNPIDFVDTETAITLLSAHLGKQVKRPTLGAWIANGFLPGIKMSGGRVLFVPRKAIPLFRLPKSGRYARRENLARGIGIALKALGQIDVSADDGEVGMACPRCNGPWVIHGGLPTVAGHEGDKCCCNLDCPWLQEHDGPYCGPNFLLSADERAQPISAYKVRFTA